MAVEDMVPLEYDPSHRNDYVTEVYSNRAMNFSDVLQLFLHTSYGRLCVAYMADRVLELATGRSDLFGSHLRPFVRDHTNKVTARATFSRYVSDMAKSVVKWGVGVEN